MSWGICIESVSKFQELLFHIWKFVVLFIPIERALDGLPKRRSIRGPPVKPKADALAIFDTLDTSFLTVMPAFQNVPPGPCARSRIC